MILEEDLSVNPEPVSKKTFHYNDQGQLLEEIFNWENSPARYEYDKNGRPRSIETITESIPTSTENAYGRCGDCGVFPGKMTYRYDDDGLLTEERVIQPGNKLIRLSEYAYDRHRHHTREWVYSADPSGKSARHVRLHIDGEDLLFNATNGLRSTSYMYDSHGNWIKAAETRLSSDRDLNSNRIVDSVTYRAIEYY